MATPAHELHRRAVQDSIRGRFALAQRSLARAAERTDDPNLLARIAGTRAYIVERTGAPAEAERICREALTIPGLTAHTIAILEGQLGSLAMYAGRLDEADELLTAAIAGLVDDAPAAARLRVNRSIVNMRRRRLRDAGTDLAHAADTFTEHGMTVEAGQARHNLGYVALLQGDLVSALGEMRAARPFSGTTPVALAIGDLDRAEVLRDAGETGEAERLLGQVARTFGTHRMAQARAEAEVALARSQLSHDPVAAARTATAAGQRLRVLGSDVWAAQADGIRVRAGLAEGVVDRQGRVTAGVRRPPRDEEVSAVAASLASHGLTDDAAAVRLAGALRRARHGETDGESIRVPPGASIDVRLLAHEVRTARAAAGKREALLRRRAAAGIDELSRWQESFGSLDLQSSVGMHGLPLMMAGLSSAIRSGRPEIVFEWSERARHFNQQVVPLRPPPDEQAAADLAELRMLRAENPTGAWLSSPRAWELHERARERQWTGTAAGGVQARVPLDALRAALGDDTALISYIWSEGELACLVVTARSARMVPIGAWAQVRAASAGLRADLDVSASVRSGPMAAVVQRALDDRLAVLSRLLLDAPVAAAGTPRVVVTTPGILAGIPWSMLPAMHGRIFTLAVSATSWVHARDGFALPRRAGLAVGPRVPRGDEEADAAAAAWDGSATVLRGADATVDAVAGLAAHVDVLHVAAHGRHTGDNPMFSGLELADGALFGYDIDRIAHVPGTVVLSACEVGRSSVRWGEEALGMTRTWLHSGSRCVIAAPVVVADDVACELLGALHAGLAAGVAPADALAAASASTGVSAPFQCHGSGF